MTTRPTGDDLVAWLNEQGDVANAELPVLSEAISTALDLIESRVDLPAGTDDDNYPPRLRTAILITASRIAKRSHTPEGVAGWGDFGPVRLLATDPDVEVLISRYRKVDGFH